ncbi:MAG: RNA polymerase sigma-70 factor [Cytophagales bacterium]|nr:RNA polymerase sigma-70 factor [Cytophagales bacterium]
MSNKDEVRKLVERISLKDNERAFRDFFDLYYTRLIRLAHYYVESQHASEEIVSAVFIGVWNNRKKLMAIPRLEAYLFSSVKYKCLNYLRDNKKNEFYSLDAYHEALRPEFKDPASDLLSKELREKVLQIINNLPPRCKLIFELVKDDGLKYREVAELLDISIKAVEAQVSKAMLTLRKEIYPYLSDDDFKRYLNRRDKGLWAWLFLSF